MKGDFMKYTYLVSIKTGDVEYAGTDASVFIEFYGKNNELLLKAHELDTDNYDDFEQGSLNGYNIVTERRIDDIAKIRLFHDNAGKRPGWFVEYVSIYCPETRKKWDFYVHRWLSVSDDDKRIDRIIERTDHIYEVTVYTGNRESGGTDANVYITLYGETGQTPETTLDDASRDDFEVNNVDKFTIRSSTNLGKIKSVRIRHDNYGKNPGWFLQAIKVTHLNDSTWYYFNAYRWLSVSDAPRDLDVVLSVSSYSGDRTQYRNKSALILTNTNDAKKYGGSPMLNLFKEFNIPTYWRHDSTKLEIENTINSLAANKTDDSLSIIYINCHGGTAGINIATDIKCLTYSELKKMLDRIRGVKVLLLDTCNAGSVISLQQAVIGDFRSNAYHILCACDENGKDWDNGRTANVWCSGFRDLKKKDNSVTVQELYDYTLNKYEGFVKRGWKRHQRPQMWSANPNVIII